MKKLITKAGLTKKELIVISFLFITFIAGVVVKYSGWKKPKQFEYSGSGRQFDSQMKQTFTSLEENNLSEEQKNLIAEQKNLSADIKQFSDSLTSLKDSDSGSKKKLTPGKKINLNTAYQGDLVMLPGVGEVTAERIIEYREQKGRFTKPEDIKNVKGIGDKKFEQLKEFITVE